MNYYCMNLVMWIINTLKINSAFFLAVIVQKKITEIEETMDSTELKLKTKTESFNETCHNGEDAER